jgi:hypothetical protein
MKHFHNIRNAIPYIQDIKIINAFCDGVNDIKAMEEIVMKKSKMVADLLAVADVCIEASEAQARLLESRGKGTSLKKDDHDVNTADRGDRKDRGDCRFRGKQTSEQKEKRSFWRPDDAEKWCEIHCTTRHDLETCKNFLDWKKMPPPAAPVPQEPRQIDQRQVDSNGDEQMGEINVIFRGNMSIASKMLGKKLQHEISLAQHIEPGSRVSWSDVDISFRPEGHLNAELSDRNLPFIVKIPIRCHKVAKTLIDSGSSLNLMLRKTFIEMDLNLAGLTPMHDTFCGIITGQSSTPIGCIDLQVSCGT